MNNMRRVRVQLSGKVDMLSPQQSAMRKGIFDLLQKVRPAKGAEPITSNLPSENMSMGIGSSRIKGTGRTAGILMKKLVKQGIVSADGSEDGVAGGASKQGGKRGSMNDDLTWLKNAMGQEIAFDLEKGGGARANLLATGGRTREKLVDAAAMKIDDSSDDEEEQFESNYVTDETDELRAMNDHDRRAAFQAQYKIEFERQKKLMGLSSLNSKSEDAKKEDGDADSIKWEDG
eukprot:scaffold16626_cov66-Cyclotella_meneghiniana.AAC.7